MSIQSLFESFFYSSDSIILMSLIAIFSFTGFLIVQILYLPRLRSFISEFQGINGTFYSPAATMFALAVAFMGATLVANFSANNEAIRAERTALLLYLDFVDNTPPLANKNLQYGLKEYLQSALEEEWPLLGQERTSPNTQGHFRDVFKVTLKEAPALEGSQAARELAQILQSWYEARSKRLSFRWHQIDHSRWLILFIVAFLLQISMAAPHLGSSKKAMGLAMGITTALIIAVMAPLALTVDNYSGSIAVTKKPLIEVFEVLSERFEDDR
jgi:hypothetical protein